MLVLQGLYLEFHGTKTKWVRATCFKLGLKYPAPPSTKPWST